MIQLGGAATTVTDTDKDDGDCCQNVIGLGPVKNAIKLITAAHCVLPALGDLDRLIEDEREGDDNDNDDVSEPASEEPGASKDSWSSRLIMSGQLLSVRSGSDNDCSQDSRNTRHSCLVRTDKLLVGARPQAH